MPFRLKIDIDVPFEGKDFLASASRIKGDRDGDPIGTACCLGGGDDPLPLSRRAVNNLLDIVFLESLDPLEWVFGHPLRCDAPPEKSTASSKNAISGAV